MRLLATLFLAFVLSQAWAVKLQLLGVPADRIEGEYLISYERTSKGAHMLEEHLGNWQSHFAEEPVQLGKGLGLQTLVARLTDEELAKLEDSPHVEEITHNMIMRKSQTVQNGATQGLDRINQGDLQNRNELDNTYSYLNDGSGVDIYVLDTGIDVNHPGWAAGQATFLSDCSGNQCTNNRDPGDPDGHGTHVAGTSASPQFGVAKGASVFSVRVLGDDGSGSIQGIINGIQLVINRAAATGRPSVINMSLGGGRVTALNNAAAAAWDNGVVVVVAAGNEAQDAANVSPASEPSIITVGSVVVNRAGNSRQQGVMDDVSVFSNTGDIDIFAPGSDITSLRAGTDGTLTISGTSMASPHVAGACALLLGADNSRTPDQVLNILVATATVGTLTQGPANIFDGTPNLLLNTQSDEFGNNDPAPPTDAPEEMETQPPAQEVTPPRMIETASVTTLPAVLSRTAQFDIVVPEDNELPDGQAPNLQQITILTTAQFEVTGARVYVAANNNRQSFTNIATNANAWEAPQFVAVQNDGTQDYNGVTVVRSVMTLNTPIEMAVGTANAIQIVMNRGGRLVSSRANVNGNLLSTDGRVQIFATGRLSNQVFGTNAVAGIPVVELGYAPTAATLTVAEAQEATPSLAERLDCLTSQNDNADDASAQNGVYFDLSANVLDGADDVFLQGFSVWVMDNMYDGSVEVYATINGQSYMGQEANPAAWRLIGSLSNMDMDLVPDSPDADVDVPLDGDAEEDELDGIENPSTPELMDLDLNLGFMLPQDGTAQGFYLTFTDDQMRYYQANQAESAVIASNEYATMTGGKGAVYPFGGDDNSQIFDMRQFSGQACFTTGSTGGASSVVVTQPLVLLVGVVASIVFAL